VALAVSLSIAAFLIVCFAARSLYYRSSSKKIRVEDIELDLPVNSRHSTPTASPQKNIRKVYPDSSLADGKESELSQTHGTSGYMECANQPLRSVKELCQIDCKEKEEAKATNEAQDETQNISELKQPGRIDHYEMLYALAALLPINTTSQDFTSCNLSLHSQPHTPRYQNESIGSGIFIDQDHVNDIILNNEKDDDELQLVLKLI